MTLILESSPPDWPQRARAKTLIRVAERYGLREMVHVQALSTYGSEVWNLSPDELAELEDLVAAFSAKLEIARQRRRTLN